jgi:hypothetical protein
MEIRSYRAVFDIERRIYRIDGLKLNPSGVPLRGVVYFLALLLTGALIAALPGLDALAAAIPWYLREIAAPAATAALLAVLRIDGRPFHLAAVALLAHATQPRLTLGCGLPLPGSHWRPRELLLIPDGSEARMRRMSYRGPGAVLVAVAHRRCELPDGALRRLGRRPQLVLSELRGRELSRAQLIELSPRARLRVR